MKKTIGIIMIIVTIFMTLSLSACVPVDNDYATSSDLSDTASATVKKVSDDVNRPQIMSDDSIMPGFVDISVFDEENYSEIYLGKKFKFNLEVDGDEFSVPTTISKLNKKGWELMDAGQYNDESLIYAHETVSAVFENEQGFKINATFFNSSKSSVKLKKCNIVKIKIENDFYKNSTVYNKFNVNGVNNQMAITDIIDTLGTPSHFYGVSENDYYLDYFITKKDRRNGITVYVNPTDDYITAIEFSYYK